MKMNRQFYFGLLAAFLGGVLVYGSLVDGYYRVLFAPDHLGAEVTVSLFEALIAAPIVSLVAVRALRRHDREVHHK